MAHFTFLDRCILHADAAMQVLFSSNRHSTRSNPARHLSTPNLSEKVRRQSAGLMRVNHAGEVSAQALYRGQALLARDPKVQEKMQIAAQEEIDHLVWCEERLSELNSRASHLDPIWYLASFSLGAIAGFCGDRWSLGFVAETERQVEAHLKSHLEKIDLSDERSRAILEQMKVDEQQHAAVAEQEGAAKLPLFVRCLMKIGAKCMTTTAYWF